MHTMDDAFYILRKCRDNNFLSMIHKFYWMSLNKIRESPKDFKPFKLVKVKLLFNTRIEQ